MFKGREERRMKYEQKVQVEMSEYICLVKRIDGVVAQKTLEQELIRCKDCRHFNRLSCPMSRTLPYDGEHSDFVAVFRNNADDFCSKAERREE